MLDSGVSSSARKGLDGYISSPAASRSCRNLDSLSPSEERKKESTSPFQASSNRKFFRGHSLRAPSDREESSDGLFSSIRKDRVLAEFRGICQPMTCVVQLVDGAEPTCRDLPQRRFLKPQLRLPESRAACWRIAPSGRECLTDAGAAVNTVTPAANSACIRSSRRTQSFWLTLLH
jgi:hypothetical protein